MDELDENAIVCAGSAARERPDRQARRDRERRVQQQHEHDTGNRVGRYIEAHRAHEPRAAMRAEAEHQHEDPRRRQPDDPADEHQHRIAQSLEEPQHHLP